MVLVQNLKFCQRFVLCKTHREKVFGDVLVRKQAFLENINMDLKERKISIFGKGIVHYFGQKVEGFYLLCLSKIYREKVFADVLAKKEAFKDYKNNCFCKTQNYDWLIVALKTIDQS